ncbi:MAG TPA: hypothetical protein VFS16_17820 [Acidimicrobiia bacterium]|nr:hypothetical protein [Acidimicrobiia bacterium]
MAREPVDPPPVRGHAVAAAAPPGSGYWLVGADGGVHPVGVPALGSLSGTRPARPIVGAAATPGGSGYWLVGSDGGIFAFGDAGFFGSTGATRLNEPIVGMAATPSGNGYWLVASDGGIFAFGDAGFFGSTGSLRLNRPIVGMTATPSGKGYWLVGSDGGIFAFGDAGFFGSTGSILLNRPITGMSASRTGRGYRFVASDGGIFSFGDAPYAGSAAGRRLPDPIAGMVSSPTGNGYWLVASSGSVYAYGDAGADGAPGGAPTPAAPIVAIVAPPKLPGRSDLVSAPVPAGPPAGNETPRGDVPRDGAPAGDAPGNEPGPAAPAPGGPFRIALIGDTGYTAAQDRQLLKTRTAISSRPYAFVVHDGDVHGPNGPCDDERLRSVHEVFDGFSMPFVYTPGDNEWADCPDPAGRLAAIRQRFFSTDQSLGQRRMPLTRQAAPFVENSRWTAGNVVFATLNVPGPSGRSGGAQGLSAANIAWLNAAFDTALAQASPGVMIIWQDDPLDGSSDEALNNTLVERARAFGKPVALVHGHSHFYRLTAPWDRAPNLVELQTFALQDTNWWVDVTVDPAGADVFRFAKEQT